MWDRLTLERERDELRVDHTLDSKPNDWGDRPLVTIYYTSDRHTGSRIPSLVLPRIPTADAKHWESMMRTIAQLRNEMHVDVRDI